MQTAKLFIKSKSKDDLIDALEQIVEAIKDHKSDATGILYSCHSFLEDSPYSILLEAKQDLCPHMKKGRCRHEDYPEGFIFNTLCGTDECPLHK